jgi:hypothetical protein
MLNSSQKKKCFCWKLFLEFTQEQQIFVVDFSWYDLSSPKVRLTSSKTLMHFMLNEKEFSSKCLKKNLGLCLDSCLDLAMNSLCFEMHRLMSNLLMFDWMLFHWLSYYLLWYCLLNYLLMSNCLMFDLQKVEW